MPTIIDTESITGIADNATPFDFIIIGGGTSGLVVANRLTEDPAVRVLVLEAGPNSLNDPRIRIPGLAPTLYEDPNVDWDFKSTPQPQLNGRRTMATKGKTLGGSSAINLGMVIYPSRAGFNAWEELGNPGWGWDGIAKYVRKFHTATEPPEKTRQFFNGALMHDQNDQGRDGPVQVSFGDVDTYMPYHTAWFDAFKELGYPPSEDPIDGAGRGPFVSPSTVDPETHTRSHAGVAYLRPEVLSRPNLRIVTCALVERIVFETQGDEATATATAVQFSKNGQSYTIPARKEVILAAGTTQTPQILELSGIGNAELLQSHGIKPVVDNPGVGENLQDHAFIPHSYEVADNMPSGDMGRDPSVAAASMAAYEKDGSGPLGYVPFVAAFMPCLETSPEERTRLEAKMLAEIESASSRTHKKQFTALHKMLRHAEEPTCMYGMAPFSLFASGTQSTQDIFGTGAALSGYFISFVAMLMHPFSRGSVHVQSADPRDAPAIDHGLLRSAVDVELLARHSMWMEKVAGTGPMASLLKPGGERLHTPERVTDLEKAQELCKELVLSMYHPTGTCAMMPREDGGVVDARLKVYGTSNVRVVDASLFPLEPRGNTQATVYTVAEKAADIIKGENA